MDDFNAFVNILTRKSQRTQKSFFDKPILNLSIFKSAKQENRLTLLSTLSKIFMYSIDINCDLGESFGAYQLGNNPELLKYISSANIACGFHAGDPKVIFTTLIQCVDNNVKIGAHP